MINNRDNLKNFITRSPIKPITALTCDKKRENLGKFITGSLIKPIIALGCDKSSNKQNKKQHTRSIEYQIMDRIYYLAIDIAPIRI